jgi:hypothetical protein
MKEGTGQSAPRLPVARTESRLSARAPDPSPLARATPHRSGRAPARSPTTPPKSSTPTAPTTGAIKTNTANGANNTDPKKSGLNQMLEDATTSPEEPSGYVKTNYLQVEPRQERGGHRNTANHQTRPQKVPLPPVASSPNPDSHGRSRRLHSQVVRVHDQLLNGSGPGEQPRRQRRSGDPVRRHESAATST